MCHKVPVGPSGYGPGSLPQAGPSARAPAWPAGNRMARPGAGESAGPRAGKGSKSGRFSLKPVAGTDRRPGRQGDGPGRPQGPWPRLGAGPRRKNAVQRPPGGGGAGLPVGSPGPGPAALCGRGRPERPRWPRPPGGPALCLGQLDQAHKVRPVKESGQDQRHKPTGWPFSRAPDRQNGW